VKRARQKQQRLKRAQVTSPNMEKSSTSNSAPIRKHLTENVDSGLRASMYQIATTRDSHDYEAVELQRVVGLDCARQAKNKLVT
jgi:hypothetical protein